VELQLFEISSLLILGVFVGLGASLFGLGGGVFIVPLLPSISNMGAHETVLISLATVMTVVFTNVVQYSKLNLVDWKKAIFFAPFAAFGGALAAIAATYIEAEQIRIFTGVLLIILAVRLFIKPSKQKAGIGQFVLSLISAFAGFASGLSGVGTGAILSPIFMREKVVPSAQVSPTSNAILLITTLVTLFTYLVRAQMGASFISISTLGIEIIIVVGLAAQIAGLSGRKMHVALSDQSRRLLLAAVTAGLGAWVLIRTWYA